MPPRHTLPLAALAAALAAVPASAQTVVVTQPEGTLATAPGGATQNDGFQYDTWMRRNVRSGSTAGITNTYARSGNGSAYLSGTVTNTSKADFEYYFDPSPLASGPLGTGFLLSELTSASFDFYRNGSSTAFSGGQQQNPALRFLVDGDGDLGTSQDRGYLIYEGIYNGLSAPPTDSWITATIGGSSALWLREFTGPSSNYGPSGNGRPLDDYRSGSFVMNNGNPFTDEASVYGLSFGIGSGWAGSFDGAVDNVSLTITPISFRGSKTVTFNFEAQAVVPEPSTWALLGTGLAALGGLAARRRRSA